MSAGNPGSPFPDDLVITDLLPGDPAAAGPYRLLGRLGQGGMGVVYLARSPGGRAVAVKVIRPEYAGDPEFRARFAREVGAARNVSGMFTALVVDADTQGPLPWLATAYIAGPSLADTVREQGPLPPETVLQLAAGLAEGLNAIHAAGVVHRDLKPSNVLLAHDGPRVIDFGISKAHEASMLTSTGRFVGTPGFNSPEQVDGSEVGRPSDIFSLGSVLTYAATGAGPFGEGPPMPMMYRVVNRDPDLTQVPDVLRPLIERCLAKDPAARPTPAELLAELDALGADIGQPAPEWLPESVSSAMAGYVPTTPATPRDPATHGEASAAIAVARPPDVTADVPNASRIATDTVGLTFAAAAGPVAAAPSAIGGLSTIGIPAANPTPVPAPPMVGAAETDGLGPGGPTGPDGRNLAPLPGPGQRRRLLYSAAAALVILAGIGAYFGLSGGGHDKPIGGPPPVIDLVTGSAPTKASASASLSPAPTPHPTAKPAKPAKHPVHKARPAASATAKAPMTEGGLTPTTSPASPGSVTTTHAPTSAPTHTSNPTHTSAPTAPPAQGIAGASGATALPCSDIGGTGSVPGGTAVTFSFVNHSSADVEIYYLEQNYTAEPEDTIGAGGQFNPSTTTDTEWLVDNASGGCLGIYQIDSDGAVSVSLAEDRRCELAGVALRQRAAQLR
jgi:eukaryotic-like serine/threonine-protein kinase